MNGLNFYEYSIPPLAGYELELAFLSCFTPCLIGCLSDCMPRTDCGKCSIA